MLEQGFCIRQSTRADGEAIWAVTHDGALDMSDDVAGGIALAPDGDVVVAGHSYDVAKDSDVWVRKLQADSGDEAWTTTWTGAVDINGTTYTRNDERIARSYPVGDAAQGAIYDLQGIAQVRIDVTGETATVTNKASVPVRKLARANGVITISEPALTVTGTDDLILAALLSAPELLPEVRMLAACERVLVKKGSI